MLRQRRTTRQRRPLRLTKSINMRGVKDALAKGTADKPVIIGVLSQDATSDSIVSRTKGFVDKMKALCEEVAPGKVAVQGHESSMHL